MSKPEENLKKKIDLNKNQRIDNNEVDNFLKNNNPKELNELGEHLNNLPIYNNDQIKNALNNFFRSTERNKYEQSIKNKVTNNQPLDKTELSLMYLAMVSQPNKHLNQQQLIFDTNKPIDQICNGELIFFIRSKYNSPGYLLKRVEIDLPNQKQKNKITPSINPLEKVSEAKKIGGTVELPTNIPEIKENNADFYCERLTTRAENNFPNEISKAKREIESKHRYKNDNEKLAYIKYDTLLIAFEKYTEIVGKKHNAILHQAGYKDEELESQGKLLETFQEEMQQKYPNMDTILSKLKEYEKEIENNEKKYFNDKNELKAAEENNKEFNEYIEKKTKEFNIKEIETTLIKDPETPEEAEQYLKNLNKIYVFQEEITEKNKSYGDNITKYQKYIKGATIIQNKYNIQQYSDILNKYNQDISNWGEKINFKKYENYVSLIQGDRKLNTGLKNIKTLEKLIKDQNKKLLVKEFKQVERRQQIKQEESDNFRNNLKNFNGLAYRHLNILSSLRNGLVESTIGAGTGLGVMILGLIGGKDETLAQMDRKEKRDDFLKIGQSSSQKEDVYNFDTGEFNFHADNTVSTVASSISQMLVLIHGGGGLAKGATKAFGIGEKVAGRVGLFSSSFIMQVGGSYQEAITNGLKGGEALGYGMLSATIQSGLELVSPNEVLLGKGSGITKELIKNACKSGSKESLKMIGKTFAKNVGLEIVEENIQEALQLASGNLINMAANGAFGSELKADWSWKNFASTAIITTLTTGITTGTSTGLQMNNLSSQDKTTLIEHIKNNKGTYTEVTEMIEKAIAGEVKIPNVDINQLKNLKLTLSQKIETTGGEIIIPSGKFKTPEFEIGEDGTIHRNTRVQERKNEKGEEKSRIEQLIDDITEENRQEITEQLRNEIATLIENEGNSDAKKFLLDLIDDLNDNTNDTEEIKQRFSDFEARLKDIRTGKGNSVVDMIKSIRNKKRNQSETTNNTTNGIPNFNDENGKFEYVNGFLKLKENGEEIGNAILEIKQNYIYISGLVSFKKGSGTQLIRKIVEISDILGKGGHIEANASPYFSFNGQKSYRKQLTNLGFYYKLGFRAKNPEIHKKIQEYINKGEEIPLGLNYDISIYLTDEGIQNLKNKDNSLNNYFNGKSHKFEVTETQARSNSEMMNNLLNEIKKEGITKTEITKKIEELRKKISEEYKQSTGEEFNLTDEQLLSILDAHEQDGVLGELTLGQLRVKVKILRESITDPKVRRFLLEAGFCGKENLSEDDTLNLENYNLTDKQIENIKKIRELVISIYSQNIENIKDIKLTPEQIENIKKIRDELEININTRDIEDIKDIKLAPEQIENIKKIRDDLGIDIHSWYIEDIKDIKLAPEQIENIKKIKDDLGINIDFWNIEDIKDIKLTPKQIDNIKIFKNELGINIRTREIKKIKDIKLTQEQIDNIKFLKNELGINLDLEYSQDILNIKDVKLTPEQIENIKKIKDNLCNVKCGEINKIKDLSLTDEQIKNIKNINSEFGADLEVKYLNEIKDLNLTPEEISYIKNIKEKLGLNLTIRDIKIINTNTDILETDSTKFYEGYEYSKDEIDAHQHYTKGTIIEKIEQYVQEIIPEKREILEIEIINNIRTLLITLPKTEKLNILRKISDVTEKFNTTHKYIDFDNGPYKSPKELLCAMRGITDPNIISKITDKITVKQLGLGLCFYVSNPISYSRIYGEGKVETGSFLTGGFNHRRSAIEDLRGTLSVVNGKDLGPNFKDKITWHEGQHNWNSYFMPDKNSESITRAKDEITAYLRDGRGILEIEDILTTPKRAFGIYQYEKGKAWKEHKKQVRELCGYAKDLIKLTKDPKTGLTRDKVISMLSYTPTDGRKDLHSNIIEAVELHNQNNPLPEQIQNLRQRFVSKIKERAENHQLIKNLANTWNYLFSKYKIDLTPNNLSNGVEFWRAGTALKETAINEIESCNSIDEIKHILNDPKYNHIGRGPNNKGGIEISAIIDDVIAGKVEADIIPLEIRPKITQFIKK